MCGQDLLAVLGASHHTVTTAMTLSHCDRMKEEIWKRNNAPHPSEGRHTLLKEVYIPHAYKM